MLLLSNLVHFWNRVCRSGECGRVCKQTPVHRAGILLAPLTELQILHSERGESGHKSWSLHWLPLLYNTCGLSQKGNLTIIIMYSITILCTGNVKYYFIEEVIKMSSRVHYVIENENKRQWYIKDTKKCMNAWTSYKWTLNCCSCSQLLLLFLVGGVEEGLRSRDVVTFNPLEYKRTTISIKLIIIGPWTLCWCDKSYIAIQVLWTHNLLHMSSITSMNDEVWHDKAWDVQMRV